MQFFYRSTQYIFLYWRLHAYETSDYLRHFYTFSLVLRVRKYLFILFVFCRQENIIVDFLFPLHLVFDYIITIIIIIFFLHCYLGIYNNNMNGIFINCSMENPHSTLKKSLRICIFWYVYVCIISASILLLYSNPYIQKCREKKNRRKREVIHIFFHFISGSVWGFCLYLIYF